MPEVSPPFSGSDKLIQFLPLIQPTQVGFVVPAGATLVADSFPRACDRPW